MTNMADYMRDRRARRREELISLKGGRCETCGVSGQLEFDHRVPGSQSFRLSGHNLDKVWDKILLELEKCDLLCRSCHLTKTLVSGENSGGHNKNTAPYSHGTPRMYQETKCKCGLCREAKRRYRAGEISYATGRVLHLDTT